MKTAVYLLSRTYGDSRSSGAEVLTVPLTGFTLSQPAGSRRTEYLTEKVSQEVSKVRQPEQEILYCLSLLSFPGRLKMVHT